jgi:hypothetical protein
VALFPTRVYGSGVDAQQRRQYDVASDGRFLINTVLDSAAAPITLLMNWQRGLQRAKSNENDSCGSFSTLAPQGEEVASRGIGPV